jgi:DNA-binding CsgD family transcriptional regulator
MKSQSTSESERLSALIGDIYDAALDPQLWVPALEKTCEFLRGQAAALVAKSATCQLMFEWGTEPEFLESYGRTYSMINPIHVAAVLHQKVGEICVLDEILPYREFLASRFYKEWVEPQGIVDALMAMFEKSLISYVGVSVHRNRRDGPVDGETRRRFELLYPHFRRAVCVGRIVEFHKLEAAALADALSALSVAMLLVDNAGRIVHCNGAAHALLDKGNVIRAVSGKFAAVDSEADRVLHEIFINAADGDRGVGIRGVDVPLTVREGDRYIAHVLPLTSGARRMAGTTYSAVAAVFIRKAELELPHPLETIASVFNLTSAEMRVLMMVVQFGGIRDVASVLGIGEPTVKTHLQHVFEKTGVNRQADLVKLVAGYMSPLQTSPQQ